MSTRDPDELTIVAGEFVLGLLPREEHDALERELSSNAELARAVAQWQDRLLAMSPTPDPVAPADDLWPRIERSLPQASGAAAAPPRRGSSGFWNSLQFWRFAGMTGFAAAALLAWGLLSIAPGSFTADYVAVLQAPDDKRPSWLVEVDAGRAVRLTPLVRAGVGPQQALQFWTKPEGAAGPTSLGLVPADRPVTIPASVLPGLGPNQLFEVTLEPQGGSPIGRPTGPVLAVGNAARL